MTTTITTNNVARIITNTKKELSQAHTTIETMGAMYEGAWRLVRALDEKFSNGIGEIYFTVAATSLKVQFVYDYDYFGEVSTGLDEMTDDQYDLLESWLCEAFSTDHATILWTVLGS